MKLKNILIFIYLLISLLLFTTFFGNIFVWLSFFLNFVVLSFIAYYHLMLEKQYSPFISSYITFNYLFFLVAPIIQIKGMSIGNMEFPNFFPYTASGVIITNLILLLFHIVFFVSYVKFKKKHLRKQDLSQKKDYFIPLNILILLGVSILILAMNFNYIISEISESHWITKRDTELSVSSLLIKKKVLFLIPFAALTLSVYYLRRSKKITINTVIIFLILILLLGILLFFKNPLTEKRNAIGPIYIALIYLFYPKMLNTNAKAFLFLFFSLVILFPLISTLTHVDASFSEMINNPEVLIEHYREEGIIKAFNTLHYDAFANIMATIDYVSVYGLSFGYQLLSGLLFFVPRSLWTSKPESTGIEVGSYLIEKYDFNYNNLSNPIVSEGFINFGIIGVILMAIILAYVIVKFINWLNSNDPLKKIMAFYFAIHLIFLLRGDFTNGYSYFIGTLIGALIVPKIMIKMINIIFTQKIKFK